jgi:hypothetical protein
VEEKMALVDTLQNLGIDHLFEEHIDMALHEIHESEFTVKKNSPVLASTRLLFAFAFLESMVFGYLQVSI